MPDITLYQFGPMEGVDSLSPFCTKVHRALGAKRVDRATHSAHTAAVS